MKHIGSDIPAAVTAEEFKRATHFSGDTDEDLMLTAYLGAAQQVIETAARRPIGARLVQFEIDLGPDEASRTRWWFPVAPVLSLESVDLVRDGISEAIDLNVLVLEMPDTEPRLWFRSGLDFGGGSNVLRVEAYVGADAAECKSLRQAIILIAKSWFEAGIAVEEVSEPRLSFGARALIRQMKYERPRIWG
jgi:uncharacterized phiE125 gp8 family phage protein